MKFIFKNAIPFGWPGLKGWAYSFKNDFLNASTAIFEVTGHHGKVKTTLSDRIYFVIKGRGEFILGKNLGKKTISVQATDVIIIPKNTVYDYRGKMKLFLVHIPAYDEKYEVRIETVQNLDKKF